MKLKVYTIDDFKNDRTEFDGIYGFLVEYMDNYGTDDRIAWIDDYDRYLDPTDRIDFIKDHPDYKDYMILDEKEAEAERDRLLDQCIDEAYENYIYDLAKNYYICYNGKKILRDKDDDIVFFAGKDDELFREYAHAIFYNFVKDKANFESVYDAGINLKCGAYKILMDQYFEK